MRKPASPVNFNNKIITMKVYSSSRTHPKHRHSVLLPPNVKANIAQLSTLLALNKSPSLQFSPSQQSVNADEEALTLARQFVNNIDDPYQCMLLYPLMADSPVHYAADPLLKNTTLPEQLHPLLSLYLHRSTPFPILEKRNRKIVDLFYRFVNEEAPEVYQQWLRTQQPKSIGEWLHEQCISGFFQPIYKDKEQYTIFVSNFLQQGLPYFLLSSLTALRGSGQAPTIQNFTLQRIRLCYIDKFGLNTT